MYKKYKHPESGETIVIQDENLESVMKREGFKLVGEVDKDGNKVSKDGGK
jgi:hypothetical protein